jgi:hypothetical protein
VTHQANFKTIARVAVGGGIAAAGACALFAAAPAQASPFGHHSGNTSGGTTNNTRTTSGTTGTTTNTVKSAATPNTATTPVNGNPTTPPVFNGFTGVVPTWAKGTYNTLTCPGGTCFVPRATTPLPVAGAPSAANPVVALPSGTATQIGLPFI